MSFNYQKFNTYTNILILLILFVGGVSWADNNGVWTKAEDIKSGIFGDDENGGDYKFPNNLEIENNLNVSNNVNIGNNLEVFNKVNIGNDLNISNNVNIENNLEVKNDLNVGNYLCFSDNSGKYCLEVNSIKFLIEMMSSFTDTEKNCISENEAVMGLNESGGIICGKPYAVYK